MQTLTKHLLRRILWGGRLMVMASVMLAIALGASASAKAAPSAAPAAAPVLSTLPATPCTFDGTKWTCELWATTGTWTAPGGSSVPIWGYGTGSGAATLPGPALIVNQGEAVDVILHNDLPASMATSLAFLGQNRAPDATGIGSGGSQTYSFLATDLKPGTYLYEAGFTTDGQTDAVRQVAMGLYGALVVQSTTAGTAYGTPASTFNDEALLVLSEIDPALNTSLDPTTFNMADFAPAYWLINGKAYPDTDPIGTAAGNSLLLRYVNAGLDYQSMGLLGLHQTVIANDGGPLAYPYEVVAETIASGQTLDTIATIPAATSTHYALYDAGQHLDNAGAYAGDGGGGMLTFVVVP